MPRAQKKNSGLGQGIIKKKQRHMVASDRHTTEFGSASTATSITENTSIDEFLSNAEAAQRSFEAERGQSRIITSDQPVQMKTVDEEEEEEEEFCSIPKKPDWRETESLEEFRQQENLDFLKWKRTLNKLQLKHPDLPPFEKNLEFWKQLWHIIEISDIVVQVVDARDPLFYQSSDLTNYVSEVSANKTSVLLLNKADFLTKTQRERWSVYFRESDMKTMFFSATDDDPDGEGEDDDVEFNSPSILSPAQVMTVLKRMHSGETVTAGFLGYPNVGKSSTINRFLTNKRLRVSATPGKTKHYQTHVLNGNVVLVDGPGLVIPNLDMNKAAMVLAGILPIDNLTEFIGPIELLLSKVPMSHILKHYGIMKSCVISAKRQDKTETLQLLSAFGLMRGFMKPGGPDHSKAARVLLKDFVTGKLLFCKAPPGADQQEFCPQNLEPVNVDEEEFDMPLTESFPELRVNNQVHIRGVGPGVPKMPKERKMKKRKEKIKRAFPEPSY